MDSEQKELQYLKYLPYEELLKEWKPSSNFIDLKKAFDSMHRGKVIKRIGLHHIIQKITETGHSYNNWLRLCGWHCTVVGQNRTSTKHTVKSSVIVPKSLPCSECQENQIHNIQHRCKGDCLKNKWRYWIRKSRRFQIEVLRYDAGNLTTIELCTVMEDRTVWRNHVTAHLQVTK